ncbi:MAG: hypothetical protein EXR58_07510 [Chloroflexi bacterium]|nr:hypothetical protein [Chloroflexota bacterium]
MSTSPAPRSLPRTIEALGEKILLDDGSQSVAVESKSNPGHFYRVNLHSGHPTGCTCPGFTYRHQCRHLAAAVEGIRIAGLGIIEWPCGCWKPKPFGRGSDLWGYCSACGGVL